MERINLFENFSEKTKITLIIVKYGLFILPLLFLINPSMYKWFLSELIILSFELPLMLLFVFCFHLYRDYEMDEIIELEFL